ncbi:hypothetical protein Tco_1373350, partial [Tanacetum coccineum]
VFLQTVTQVLTQLMSLDLGYVSYQEEQYTVELPYQKYLEAYYSISPARYYKDDSCWSVDLKSKTTKDIISIGSFMEVLVLILYVLVRKIL